LFKICHFCRGASQWPLIMINECRMIKARSGMEIFEGFLGKVVKILALQIDELSAELGMNTWKCDEKFKNNK